MIDDREREQSEGIIDAIAKDAAARDLSVTVEGNTITVAQIGTEMWSTHEKRPENPHLVCMGSWREPSATSPAVSQFRARAFQAAIAKARELGWIV